MADTIEIPRRREVIRAWSSAAGSAGFAAVFPIHYPRELLRAHGLLPVEVWGPPGTDEAPGAAHLQAYTCPIVRKGLSFLLAGGLEGASAVVVPHGCDSLQGLGSILLDFLADEAPPVVPFYVPRNNRGADTQFLERELAAVGARLAEVTGHEAGADELAKAIEREERADGLLADLHRQRRRLDLSDFAFYRLLRSREYLPAERFSELAEGALAAAGDQASRGVPILLSGIVPEPMEGLFEALEEMGTTVVADDLACCGRRLYPPGRSDKPYRRMAERILGAPPDPMRGNPIQERVNYLRALVSTTGARGVVFYDVKFCEPELFDLPALRQAFQADGTPTLSLEIDLSAELPGQTLTRLEAFVEMLG